MIRITTLKLETFAEFKSRLKEKLPIGGSSVRSLGKFILDLAQRAFDCATDNSRDAAL